MNPQNVQWSAIDPPTSLTRWRPVSRCKAVCH